MRRAKELFCQIVIPAAVTAIFLLLFFISFNVKKEADAGSQPGVSQSTCSSEPVMEKESSALNDLLKNLKATEKNGYRHYEEIRADRTLQLSYVLLMLCLFFGILLLTGYHYSCDRQTVLYQNLKRILIILLKADGKKEPSCIF